MFCDSKVLGFGPDLNHVFLAEGDTVTISPKEADRLSKRANRGSGSPAVFRMLAPRNDFDWSSPNMIKDLWWISAFLQIKCENKRIYHETSAEHSRQPSAKWVQGAHIDLTHIIVSWGNSRLSLGRMILSNLLQDLCDVTFLSDEELFARIPDHDLAVPQSSPGKSCARAMIRIWESYPSKGNSTECLLG